MHKQCNLLNAKCAFTFPPTTKILSRQVALYGDVHPNYEQRCRKIQKNVHSYRKLKLGLVGLGWVVFRIFYFFLVKISCLFLFHINNENIFKTGSLLAKLFIQLLLRLLCYFFFNRLFVMKTLLYFFFKTIPCLQCIIGVRVCYEIWISNLFVSSSQLPSQYLLIQVYISAFIITILSFFESFTDSYRQFRYDFIV